YQSHTGSRSELINSGPIANTFNINNLKISESVKEQGLILKFWAKINNSNNCYNPIENGAITIEYRFNNDPLVNYGSKTPVSKSGEWYLYEVVFPQPIFTMYNETDLIKIQIKNTFLSCVPNSYEDIFLDDILVKP